MRQLLRPLRLRCRLIGNRSKRGDIGLLYAFTLAPYDLSLRMEAAKIFLAQENVVQARKALLPVAFNDESGTFTTLIREVITTLDKDGASAALTSLNKATDKLKADAEKSKKG